MMKLSARRSGVIFLSLAAFSIPICVDAAQNDRLEEARRLYLTGRYEEAAKLFGELAGNEPVAAAIGLARCHWSTGKHDEGHEVLEAASDQHPADADLTGELAFLAFQRGNHEAAGKLAGEALKSDAKQLTSRWVNAELHRVVGRMEEANMAYGWFIDYYNDNDTFTTEDLRWIGLAAARYARWNRNNGQFRLLVNTLYPDALELDENYWPSHLEAATLFLEKYNERDAKAELDAASTINANAAEIHAARAELALQKFDLHTASSAIDRALKVNPRFLLAHQLRGDCRLAALRVRDAIGLLEKARELNPVDEDTLGRPAAAYGAADGLTDVAADSRMASLIEEVTGRNEHCGRFFMALADSLDRMRRYPATARYYREAERRMPQLMYARGRLGLTLMRLGEEAEAVKLLDESFEIDPFNVRVKNMLEVLDVLEGYASIETDHFIIKYDRDRDQVLAEYAARYLEDQVYAEITQELGYKPPDKSLFEIFSRAKNTSGHGWFSARMVGLPFIGTVGACAGKMVAMASPNDMPKKYDWARVLRHEFVHVVNLQQTDFRIPHWYTEGLAVLHEGLPRPSVWNEVLARRAKADTLFDLDTITLGFIRPKDQADWALAYCQAELYVQFMLERFGDEATANMLDAYEDNLSTKDALKRCFGVEQARFESEYREYLAEIVDCLREADARTTLSFADLHEAVERDPKNADLCAELAYQYLRRGVAPTARKYAVAARESEAKHQLATYVLARLHLSIGDVSKARNLLVQTLDEQDPQENTLGLLAALRLKGEEYDEAERLYRLGAERYPDSPKWLKSLARVYLQSGNQQKLTESLSRLAESDYDNVIVRKKLLELSFEAEDFGDAIKWANQVLHIDVMDAEVHALLARALGRQQEHQRAIDEYETAIDLSPERTDWPCSLAETCIRAGRKEKAIAVLEEVLARRPDHAEAKRLLGDLSE